MPLDRTTNRYATSPAIPALTDNSGGSVSNTLAAITDGPTKNAIASLNAQMNLILAALRAKEIISN